MTPPPADVSQQMVLFLLAGHLPMGVLAQTLLHGTEPILVLSIDRTSIRFP